MAYMKVQNAQVVVVVWCGGGGGGVRGCGGSTSSFTLYHFYTISITKNPLPRCL